VFSSIDHGDRYAYAKQPSIAHWNLARLAECLIPILSENKDEAIAKANAALTAFPDLFKTAYQSGLRDKLGLSTEQEGDGALIQDLLDRMAANQADFTLTFRRLCDAAASAEADGPVRDLFVDPTAYDAWAITWRARLAQDPQEAAARTAAMKRVNPAFIARNYRVEAVIEAAVTKRDFTPFEDLLSVLAKPYDDQPGFEHYADAPPSTWGMYQTFCGT
jgi:uncharacterized protein YdiU (UPF0061 family)